MNPRTASGKTIQDHLQGKRETREKGNTGYARNKVPLAEEIRTMVQEVSETSGKGTSQLQKALKQLQESGRVSV